MAVDPFKPLVIEVPAIEGRGAGIQAVEIAEGRGYPLCSG